jgi:hypothetical protein
MAELDADKLELLERQLAERVTERVRPALFRLYAAVGLAVIGALGFVSWDIVDDIKSEIKSELTDEVAAAVDAKRAEITEQVTETRIMARRANSVIQRVEKQLDDFQPQADNLDETIAKVRSLNVTSQDLLALYVQELEPLTANVATLSAQLRALAEQVDQLNTLATEADLAIEAPVPLTYTQRGDAIQSVIADTRQADQRLVDARDKVTVFVQFSGGREQAAALAASLRTDGYVVPAQDREASAAGRHEVRYFHEDDQDAAQRLAEDTTRILRQQGFAVRVLADIRAVSLVSYSGKKPRRGILELWLDIPPT